MDRNLQGPKNDGSHINTLNSAQKRNSKIEAYDRWTQSSHIVIEHCPIRSRPPIAHSPAQNASQRREPGSEQRQKNKTTRAQVPPRTNPWDHRKGGGGGGRNKNPRSPRAINQTEKPARPRRPPRTTEEEKKKKKQQQTTKTKTLGRRRAQRTPRGAQQAASSDPPTVRIAPTISEKGGGRLPGSRTARDSRCRNPGPQKP